jgi:threonine dehydratase
VNEDRVCATTSGTPVAARAAATTMLRVHFMFLTPLRTWADHIQYPNVVKGILGRLVALIPLSPLTFAEVLAARERIRRHLTPTPMRSHPLLDAAVGGDIRVYVKHEDAQPTGSFKVRNAVSAMTHLMESGTPAGVVAATRGNHGLGVAWAGQRLGIPVWICVPFGNNPEKNAAIRALGATLVEEGRDYDESIEVAQRLVRDRGLALLHSTNDRAVVAGAGTMTLEIVEAEGASPGERAPELDAMIYSVGGGSQAVGGMTVLRERAPQAEIFAVQAAGAPAIHDAWRLGHPVSHPSAQTFADGLATRNTYEMTFPALRDGLTDFVTVTDAEIAAAVRLALTTTHRLLEGAGAAGLAALWKLRTRLAGRGVGIVYSGANIDLGTLRRVVSGEL